MATFREMLYCGERDGFVKGADLDDDVQINARMAKISDWKAIMG